jgi:hypothetical protein
VLVDVIVVVVVNVVVNVVGDGDGDELNDASSGRADGLSRSAPYSFRPTSMRLFRGRSAGVRP